MSTLDHSQGGGVEGLAFPFPDKRVFENGLDVINTVQFIGAAITHAEIGRVEETQEHLELLSDKVFAKNMALYLYGVTSQVPFKEFADGVKLTDEAAMQDVSREAITAYFRLDNRSPESQQSTDTAQADKEAVREEVWFNLASLRIAIENSEGVELAHAKELYDEELTRSISKLIKAADFEVAHDMATGSLTKTGQQTNFAEYDRLIVNSIRSSSGGTALVRAQALSLTTFTYFGSLKAKEAYGRQVITTIRSMHSEADLEIASTLAASCTDEYGRSESKRAVDSLVLKLISQALLEDRHADAVSLQRRLKTYYAQETAKALFDNGK